LKGVGVPGKGNLPQELVGTTYARYTSGSFQWKLRSIWFWRPIYIYI